MSRSLALLIDELHNAAVADTPTVREATLAPGIVVTVTMYPATGSTGWRLNGRRSHRAAIYRAATKAARRAAEAEQVATIRAQTQERRISRKEHDDVQRVLAMLEGGTQLHHAAAQVAGRTTDRDRLDARVREELLALAQASLPTSTTLVRACRVRWKQ